MCGRSHCRPAVSLPLESEDAYSSSPARSELAYGEEREEGIEKNGTMFDADVGVDVDVDVDVDININLSTRLDITMDNKCHLDIDGMFPRDYKCAGGHP